MNVVEISTGNIFWLSSLLDVMTEIYIHTVMKRKHKQQWSPILPIPTKRIITSNLN